MTKGIRYTLLFIVITAVVVVINYLDGFGSGIEKAPNVAGEDSLIINEKENEARIKQKSKKYEVGKEISTPDHFINSEPFKIQDNIGKKVILVDFWTYSCINCQRTLPYLNEWQKKYADKGLLIVGVHTPEFEFEKDKANVEEAVKKFGIEYPVVMDNDFSTWRSYKNRFWPRKYIIDIDGFIRYDHIGEGNYEETEKVIQDLLKEKSDVLKEEIKISSDTVKELETGFYLGKSPEIYFGAARNETLANGMKNMVGKQSLMVKNDLTKDKLYLEGMWNIQPEYVEVLEPENKVLFKFKAKNVYMVAGSDKPVKARIYLNGKEISSQGGKDLMFDENGPVLKIKEEKLYELVAQDSPEEGILEIRFDDAGAKLFTFTFD